MYDQGLIFGVTFKEASEAIFFYQKFKDMPTYKQTLKQIKREHLESELARINAELGELG